MSQLTQQAIVETTMRLVEQKTVKKITVRDIVEACGITRNTFYYYFHDIYEVLRRVLSPFEFRIWECYVKGESAREIAAAVGKSEKSVTNAIGRIRKKLRDARGEFDI